MTKRVEELCEQLARDGVSAASLFELADACILCAKNASPALMWLGLAGFFRARATSLDDRCVPTSDVDALSERLRPLLSTLSQQSDGPSIIEHHVGQLRDLF